MSAFEPSAPAQPSQSDTYIVSDNQASKQPDETSISNTNTNTTTAERRTVQQQPYSINEATASSLGRGVEGAPPGEESKGRGNEDVGRHNELEADQMAAPGEGKVWKAVEGSTNKPGSGGEQPDFMDDLDRYEARNRSTRCI